MAMTRREASRSRTITLRELESTVRAAWSADTCDPVDLAAWHRGNPARGQCGVTALVLHDVLGGELLVAQVESAEGVRQGVHWWNRLPGGVEVDLTREQFTNGEVIGEPRTVPRPPGPSGRCAEQYRLLRTRVSAALRMSSTRTEADLKGIDSRPGLE